MEIVATEKQRKQAFRQAYEFLESHLNVLHNPDEYAEVADHVWREAEKCDSDPLTMRMILAVVEYIYSVQKGVEV